MNYRRDIFETPATAKAFEGTLDEACELHRWKLHAYVVTRNHYPLALEKPGTNLVAGMHWFPQPSYSEALSLLTDGSRKKLKW